jgi:tetratricopeptide (TPR) repeat protein
VVLEATAKAEKADLHIPKANIARIEREKDEQRPPAPTDPMKESERLAKELAEYYTKARMNAPAKFEYEYEAAPDDEGIFRFKDQGRQWRYRSDLCIGYCEKAMETGRKRLALLKKSPDTPKLKEDVQSTKAIIVQIYAFEQKVLANRGRKGRGGEERGAAPMNNDGPKQASADPQGFRRIAEEALRRGQELKAAHNFMEAIGCYDQALEAIEKMADGQEKLRLKMEALWAKGLALDLRSPVEAVKLYEQSFAIAEQLGDRKAEADKLVKLGLASFDSGKKREFIQRALKAYQDLADKRGEAECAVWMGSSHLFAKEFAPGKRCYEQALPLFESVNAHEWVAVCRAALALLAEVGEDRWPTLLYWSASCPGLKKSAGAVEHRFDVGSGTGGRPDIPALKVTSVFWQVSHLRKFLDASVPVAGSWSGSAFSYSHQALRATVTVKSASERVSVPAGQFGKCLLTEQVTTESGLPDEAAESRMDLNREALCGTRQAWYAPGVGLVQLHVERGDGIEATIHLEKFSVANNGQDYLPLAIGNSWTYGWADLPDNCVAKETYRVAANAGDTWYLEHYSYAYAK